MNIKTLNNYGTIQEIRNSNVYITPQGIVHTRISTMPAREAEEAVVAEEKEVAEVAEVPAEAEEAPLTIETEDERHARCIRTLFGMRGAKGRPLITFSSQWTAIYCILVDYHGYPTEYVGFHRRMQRLGVDTLTPPCTYEALKDIDGLFARPFEQWKPQSYPGQTAVFERNYQVASILKGLLEE